jgi:hypothetical protein
MEKTIVATMVLHNWLTGLGEYDGVFYEKEPRMLFYDAVDDDIDYYAPVSPEVYHIRDYIRDGLVMIE